MKSIPLHERENWFINILTVVSIIILPIVILIVAKWLLELLEVGHKILQIGT